MRTTRPSPVRFHAEAASLVKRADRLAQRARDASKLAEAVRAYRKAFRLGSTLGAYNLAVTYQNLGKHVAAVRWFRRALAGGDLSALVSLAQAEMYGCGTRRDPDAALVKLARIARGGSWFSPFDQEQAMIMIADAKRHGWLVRRDERSATRWLRRAAKLGSAHAAGLLMDLGE